LASRTFEVEAPLPTAPEVPGFRCLRLLGESSRATVWLAYSLELQKEVALKIGNAEPDDAESGLFGREYQALAGLEHAGVVDIYDYGMHAQREFLAMEYFPEGDLRRRMQQGLTPAQAMGYLQKLCTSLIPVHQAGMMHLDLKPPNIMVRADDSLVLIDFGLVRHMGTAGGSTVLGVRRGSPYYMSPEQVQGLPLDARSDVYSLGILLYEMLAGRRPFEAATAFELMDQHVRGPRPPLPVELARFEPLLDLMTSKAPLDRPAGANALHALLLQIDDDEDGGPHRGADHYGP
jgi:serine/threonine protein kinase